MVVGGRLCGTPSKITPAATLLPSTFSMSGWAARGVLRTFEILECSLDGQKGDPRGV